MLALVGQAKANLDTAGHPVLLPHLSVLATKPGQMSLVNSLSNLLLNSLRFEATSQTLRPNPSLQFWALVIQQRVAF